jgi:hypothetical protein
MDDPVTLLDIIMVSFFSFVLCYLEKRHRLAKEQKPVSSVISHNYSGRKFYWIRLDKGEMPQVKIWTKKDPV